MVINEPEGAEVHVVESAGKYLDQLVDLEGNPLNEELFDHIGDFYQGLGITRRDRKLGLMDNKGNVLIEPIFPFDKTEYPGSTWKFLPQVLNEDLLLIPIDGKVGIIKITRS